MVNTNKIDFYLLIVLVVFFVSSIFFISHYLYNWDAGQFALGLETYDIKMHQPHPPGYPVFIAAGKIINSFVQNANLSLTCVSLFFALLSVLFLYFLVKKIFPNNHYLALAASLFLMLNPVFWFYRELALTYTVDTFIVVFLLWIFYKNKQNYNYLYLGSLILGIAGGFRPTIIVFLLPLLIANFFFIKKNKIKRSFICLLILVLSILSWLVPMLVLTGGVGEYYKILKNLFSAAEASVPLFQNIKTFYGVLAVAINILFFPLIISLFKIKRQDLLLALVAGLPALLVYTFMHFGQPGYVLLLLPVFIFLSLPGINSILQKPLLRIIFFLLLICEAGIFLALNNRVSNPVTYPATNSIVKKINAVDPWLFKFNYYMIKENDNKYALLIKNLQQDTQDYTLIIAVRNLMYKASNGMSVRNDENFRQIAYYLKDLNSYYNNNIIEIAPNRNYYLSVDYCFGTESGAKNCDKLGYYTNTFFSKNIKYNKNQTKIIILAQNIEENDMPKDLTLTKKNNYYIGSLTGIDEFDFSGFKFIKK